MIDWYVKLLVNHPRKVIATVVLLCSTTIIVPYFIGRLPQFSHPELGFETRGTEIGNRQVTWDNLIKVLEKGTELIDDVTRIPINFLPQHYGDMDLRKNDIVFQFGDLNHNTETTSEGVKKSLQHTTVLDDEIFEESEVMTLRNDKKRRKNRLDFFCSKPTYDHARVVFTLNEGENLLTYQSVKDMCLLQERLENLAAYKDVCDVQDHTCCPPWSLVNYITLLRKHKSCSEIIPKDINATMTILDMCAHFYYDSELLEWKTGVRTIPRPCVQFNAVYNLMHYHLDVNFLPPHAPSNVLTSSMMFLPFGKGSVVHVYNAMQDVNLSTPLVSISAIDFGIKEKLFDIELVGDIYLIFLSIFFIMLCVLFYTWSLIITVVTLLNILFSLTVSYFVYTFVFGISFFPFMNVLAIIVLIGVSADSSFIMCDVWKVIKLNDQADSLVDVISKTLKHSLLSISLSTTTTFCAFASSFLSAINGISCFSIFSAMAVFVNLLITVSLLPACIVLLSSQRGHNVIFDARSTDKLISIEQMLRRIQTSFNAWLLKIVFRFRWAWIAIYSCLGLCSMIVIWIWPGMKLPESVEFQLFRESHPFEQYDLIYKNQFWFERILRIDNNPENRVPLRFVWGLFPNDTGSHLDPEDHGRLVYDPNFDMAHPKSQSWLLQFCAELRTQPFYRAVGGPQMTNCFMETFVKWMGYACVNSLEQNRWPCCNSFDFPYPRNVFHFCIIKAMYIVYNTPSTLFVPSAAGPKFSNPLYHSPNHTLMPIIKTVVVEFESNFVFTTSYVEMENFYKQVESWSSKMMETAPPGLRNGWFYSHLGFYDLQKTLIEDTVMSAFIALVLAFAIMLFVTTSISLTAITVLTIFFIICTTIAVLVLMGWRLNVLESIATSVAIGLSVDFSLHYTIEYQLACEDSPRATAVSKALSLMACPSLMGAITTGASGAFMLPSDVLPYAQLGIFLIVIMFISWLYSTFFLVSLLSVFGSDYDHGPYPYRCCRKMPNVNVNERHKRRTRHASPFSNVASESTVSCISSAVVNQSTAHELDALTAVHPIKFNSPKSKAATSCLYLNIDDANAVKKTESNVVHI